MSTFIVNNEGPLQGFVEVSGSKNAVLPLMAATLLTEDECCITDVPKLMDVEVMCGLLRSFGADVCGDMDEHRITVKADTIITTSAPCELVKKMRASVVAMGPLLARTGSARIPLPGGCAIGDRPIDLHIKGFHALGAEINVRQEEDGHELVEATATRLTGAEIYLDTPSVGATENIMMAASLADGDTVIENAAQEPEIVDLANYMNKMGARIKGAGTDIIKIKGVKSMHGAAHAVIPDRIEAGTFMLAAAITGGDVTIANMLPDHVKPIAAKLRECGCIVENTLEGTRVRLNGRAPTSTDIKTLPYPGFPTDIQPQFMTFLTTVNGPSMILETVFENRFMHIEQLNKMGANIREDGRRAFIPGGIKLIGAEVTATDLRAGAALVLAGLSAAGETVISDVYHIDRGYDNIIQKFRSIGGSVERRD
ncbi:MAG: UDP-N-acetylglucosamine 1-carboxyvinyltransferase [Clostridiales Family XIII bacterium]|nr:UDP-N-acetylglucosamine 1-carboxyvinyltransferase [Clostridiales Family XIII bacterium]